MNKPLLLAIGVAVALAGCGDQEGATSPAKVSTQFDYVPTLSTPVKFVFPAGSSTIAARTTVSQGLGKGVIRPEPYVQPKSWTIYLAASMYTDGRTERSERWVTDMVHMKAIDTFLKSNGLRDKFVLAWLQYDPIPPGQGALANKVDAGWDFMPLPFRWQDANQYFDFYIVSPSSRYGDNGRLRYDKWLKPYLWYENTGDGRIKQSIDKSAGIDDYKSAIWDKWNRHIFLVNPEGNVVDSWISVGSTTLNAFPNQVMASVAKRFNLSNPQYPRVNYDGVYFSEYKVSLEQQGINVMNDIKEKTQ
ncbi:MULTISPECIES: hypothetical protein [Pseudomonas]|uniref:Lipoprotein n=1 Tax=Pseudomonas fluorescens TaxID=294 RepID=A0A166QNV1_PSEFL|nr:MULTISPECIES: hypothetical protein [Pseudomonas]KZN20605.1 hypothetical protein A1D17_03435 [Pseudomonas fluorescens]